MSKKTTSTKSTKSKSTPPTAKKKVNVTRLTIEDLSTDLRAGANLADSNCQANRQC